MRWPKDAYQYVDHNDVLQFGPRERPPNSDALIVKIFHRTTGSGRAALMPRPAAAELHAWLGRWLAEGWDGVPRRCGVILHDEHGRWECTADPDPHKVHTGKQILWRTGQTPQRRDWLADSERTATKGGGRDGR